MYQVFLDLISSISPHYLSLNELKVWASDFGLSFKGPDCVCAFQLEDSHGNLVFFGDATENEIDIGIMPLSFWSLGDEMSPLERTEFNEAYFEVKSSIQSALGSEGSQALDTENRDFMRTKWVLGKGALWLYQDSRDPMFGSELAISIVKDQLYEPYSKT